jgi:hypothetical protein
MFLGIPKGRANAGILHFWFNELTSRPLCAKDATLDEVKRQVSALQV